MIRSDVFWFPSFFLFASICISLTRHWSYVCVFIIGTRKKKKRKLKMPLYIYRLTVITMLSMCRTYTWQMSLIMFESYVHCASFYSRLTNWLIIWWLQSIWIQLIFDEFNLQFLAHPVDWHDTAECHSDAWPVVFVCCRCMAKSNK